MKDTGNDLNNAVQLVHEAYRDGIVDSGNADETIRAVIAHTAMAANMESWGADVNLNGLLGLETAAYKSGNNQLLEAIAENCYDSSADYWKMMSNGDLVEDEDGWLKDESGNKIKDKDGNDIGYSGKETGLLNILFGERQSDGSMKNSGRCYKSFDDDQVKLVQSIMVGAHMTHTENENFRDIQWTSDGGNIIYAKDILNNFGDSVATPVFMNGYDNASDALIFSSNFSEIDHALSSVSTGSMNRFLQYTAEKNNFYKSAALQLQNLFALGKKTQSFGIPDSSVASGESGGMHKGLDFGIAEGTKLYSVFSGWANQVDNTYTEDDNLNGKNTSGKNVNIEIGYEFEGFKYSSGLQANIFHMSQVDTANIKKGQYYDAGTYLGKSGNTGFSKGAHVHFEINRYDGGIYQNTLFRDKFLQHFNLPGYSDYTGDVVEWKKNKNNYQYKGENYSARFININTMRYER